MENRSKLSRNAGIGLVELLLLAALYLTSLQSYLLFHSLIELFTIIVAAGIFIIAWNSRDYIENNYLLFIGIASVFVALLDLIHTLAYEGMGVFGGETSNLATQLWIAAQYLQAASWLLAPLFFGRRLKLTLQVIAYAVVTTLLLLSIFYWQVFPTAFVPGVGLTSFKVVSEYVISLMFLAAIILLVQHRRAFEPRIWLFVSLSLALTIAAEVAFTSYVSVYGGANLIGHLLRWVAFYLLYKAIIETGLVQPYALILRDLRHSEEQLRQYAATLKAQNEDLQARNEELDAYAHTVAHDLKNPLSVIITAGDVINEVANLTHKEQREFLMQIKATAFEMNNIVDSLLLLSEVRKVDAPLEAVDMEHLLRNVRSRLDFEVKQRHARLVLPKSWPVAMGYGPWIEEVWTNYITNALKYGGPSPRIELGATPQPDGMIRFWTRDHGPGIPDEVQASLFTPFTKLRKTHKGSHGLGLSIVLRIVQKLGGGVGVQSREGRGSEFFFTLPAAQERAPAPLRQPALQRRATASA